MSNRSLKFRLEDLPKLHPITQNQARVSDHFKKGLNLSLSGCAGSGKTFWGLYLALEEVLDKNTRYDKIIIVRSVVPTRDIGFLPGTEEEKLDAYTSPYRSIFAELFKDPEAWTKLVNQGAVEFLSTSFIRGITLSNCIILVDEMQNLNFHELDSVITRMGNDSRIIFCGDYYQSDFEKEKDKTGILQFLEILDNMAYFEHISFGFEDIVRSGIVREYIMTKEMMKGK